MSRGLSKNKQIVFEAHSVGTPEFHGPVTYRLC